ncbi:hypothetical protein CXG81DRAFT_17352 [Caulochytrium protostelioides]|uniref:PCI domain-containing protein n=1 Tax=Caulochytrium protostelioides TaxID=1555241 RepID=A0A4V1IV77_9FUNG|nr:hypothetical protein CXG81DRAFT_17352 [Caulochytrium protostelioides]|eukprot:RKP03099.1 hypothetical protein CXG81DRAFT_17352 [Caulochytrium protostelioides]
MAMAAVQTWLITLRQAIQTCDGTKLAACLAPTPRATEGQQLAQAVHHRPASDIAHLCGKSLKGLAGLWTRVAQQYLVYVDADEASRFDAASVLFTTYAMVLEDVWQFPLLSVMVARLIALADEADARLGKDSDANASRLLKAQGVLSRALSMIVNDKAPPPNPKKLASLMLANALFKILFRLHEFATCRNLVDQILVLVAQPDTRLGRFPRTQRVTFKYYAGRVYLYNQDAPNAARHLRYAFERCPPHGAAQRQLIGRYLIVARLMLGQTPTPVLLDQLGLAALFGPLVDAVQRRSWPAIQHAIAAQRPTLVAMGCLSLLLYNYEAVFYRRLMGDTLDVCRAIQRARLPPAPGAAARDQPVFKLSLQEMDAACRCAEMAPAPSAADLESMVLALIARGWIKGYMTHAQKLLVLPRKSTGFPSLPQCPL